MKVYQDTNVWEKIIKNSLDIIGTLDREGVYVAINEASKAVLGYEPEEMIGKHFSCFLHPEDLPATLATAERVFSGSRVSNFENRGIHKKGYEVFVLWSAVWSQEDEVMVCIGRDVSELKRSRQKEELQKVLVEYGVDTLAVFDKNLNYLASGGSIFKQMGYLPEQLVGKNVADYIHPQDLSTVAESLQRALNSKKDFVVPIIRFKNAQGEWRWIESTVSNQLANPAVNGLVTTSRDVTEKVNNRLKLQESEQRFKSLFENHLDVVLFQDKEGIIIDVNKTTLSFFGIPKNEITDRPFTDFLTPDLVPFCTKALEDALKGSSVRYEISIPIEDKGVVTFDVSKIPVVVSGEVIGAYSIMRDITKIHQSKETIRRQAEKLSNIMESITDAFFTLDKNWQFTYVNHELEKLFQINRSILLGKNFWKRDLGSKREELEKHFYTAINTGVPVRFEFYIENFHAWLQVKVFPSAEGLSVFMTDITESVRARQELEKLSLVASKTTNGVVITNADGLTEWVNQGFTNLTGYTLSEVAGKMPGDVLTGPETGRTTYQRLLESRKLGLAFHDELLIYKKSGEKVWFLLDITPVLNETGKIISYVTIQTDITDRKEAEASQLQLTKDLYRQNKDLQQFTYIVSHNLRSPVANAMGLVNVLSSVDKETDTFGLSLDYLKKSVHQLDTVLQDLNMILAIRDKTDNTYQERVSLAHVCEQALDDLSSLLQASGGAVNMEVNKSLQVQGDKAYLYSVFHNLLSNAIKYRSPKRSLQINIRCFGHTERGSIISFSDNGSGFDMKLAGNKVFKLYKRFHTGSEGRGMGLFLVKTHLQAMGGHIEVTSQVNVGTRFLIYLK